MHELTAIQARLKPFTATDGVSREDVDAIETARRQCDKSANDLLQILQDLKPKKTRWGGDTVRAAWRGYRAQTKIAALHKKMEGCNERLKQELTQATRKRVLHVLEDQKKTTEIIKQEVQQMHSESAASHSITQTAISSARTDLGAKLTSAALEQEASGGSLLYQLLKRKPSKINAIRACSSATRHVTWTQKRLLDVLTEVIVLYRRANECIFFLIDGLDEFEGEYLELLDVILRVELMSNAKICLSSRPEPALQVRLHQYPCIRPEDLNYDDIEKFVFSKLASITQPEADLSSEIAQRAQGMFLWAALVTVNLVQGSMARDDKVMLRERLDSFPEGLQSLFARLFSDVDKHHREFLLFVFQLLKTNQDKTVPIALVTACLQFKNIATLRDFCDQCHGEQRHVALRSKGLLEINTTRDGDSIVRGWALQDPATKEPYHTALEDDIVQLWMKLGHSTVGWLHRSAYDYVFISPEADLPAWIHETDITEAMLCGCAWLYKHGISMWVDAPAHGRPGYIWETVLGQNLSYSAYSFGNALATQLNKNPSFAYKILDDVNNVLGSSLSDGSWLVLELKASLANSYESSMSEIAALYTYLWCALVRNDLQDYVVSRFEYLKRESFAHPTCRDLLGWALAD